MIIWDKNPLHRNILPSHCHLLLFASTKNFSNYCKDYLGDIHADDKKWDGPDLNTMTRHDYNDCQCCRGL